MPHENRLINYASMVCIIFCLCRRNWKFGIDLVQVFHLEQQPIKVYEKSLFVTTPPHHATVVSKWKIEQSFILHLKVAGKFVCHYARVFF